MQFIAALHRVEAGDAGAIDSLVSLFADGARLTNPLLQHEGRERSGLHEIAAFWRQYCASFTQIRSEFSEITTGADAVGLFWHGHGKDAAGETVAYDGATLLGLDGSGKIARFQGYFDSRQVARTVPAA